MTFLSRDVTVNQHNYRYQIYMPNQQTVGAWPIILALHGGGERGSDGARPVTVGLGSALRQYPDRYPAIVVFPQVPEGTTWQDLGAEIAVAALDQTISEFDVDLSRIYLTGLSMGGNGVWYLAYHHPDRFAALVVICGWVSARQGRRGVGFPAIGTYAAVAERLQHLPIWLFHSADDPVVAVAESQQMFTALQQVGAIVEYTEFSDLGHRAWDQAYANARLPVWLLKQRKP